MRHFKRLLPKKSYNKIGHFGTLDPFADGVFLLGFNGALRLNDLLHEKYPKTYLATGILGRSTDSGDKTGKETCQQGSGEMLILEKSLTKLQLDEVALSMLGEYWQSPPAFSASKHEGRNLYEWAREGIIIEKEQKKRFIHSLEVVSFKFPQVVLRATVSSGTYIRTLFEDFAKKSGAKCGYLENLTREKISEELNIRNSITQENWSLEYLQEHAYSPDQILKFPSFHLNEAQTIKFSHGNPIFCEEETTDKYTWIYSYSGKLMGLSSYDKDLRSYKLKILF